MESKKHAEDYAKLVAQYKTVFGSEPGKAVLKDLVANNFIKGSTFSTEYPHLTSLREGQRNAILRILAMLEMDPEQFLNQPEEELSHVS